MALPEFQRNLIIVHTPRRQALSDFVAIKAMLAERAPDIEVFIAENGARNKAIRDAAATRPTVIFSPMGILEFVPVRGKVFGGQPTMTKSEQMRRLGDAGVKVPKTVVLHPGLVLDGAIWGPVVVVKPEIGKRGEGVHLASTEEARWVDLLSWPLDDPRGGQALVAQQFINTGAQATSFRVMTVFGRPVYSVRTTQLASAPSLDAATLSALPIASNAGRRTIELNFDTAVIDLARETWRAIPEVPVHGVDIVREARTGSLFVLEVNPSGRTWHISSDYGVPHQREFGIDYAAQFGALDVIADALIDATRREAC
jgi:hypothetical protein